MSEPRDYLGKCYQNGDSYMRVIGLILNPAILLKDPITGETRTVVIDCNIHKEMQEIPNQEALDLLENYVRVMREKNRAR